MEIVELSVSCENSKVQNEGFCLCLVTLITDKEFYTEAVLTIDKRVFFYTYSFINIVVFSFVFSLYLS